MASCFSLAINEKLGLIWIILSG